jgi:uncharacterized membrane protein YjgN (DUF898 family)
METNNYKKLLTFHGDHGRYVGLRIINNILKVITLGLYYPWARAAELQYLYSETEYQGSRFVFHGTGKEIFKGFIKSIVLVILIVGVFLLCVSTGNPVMAVVGTIFYIAALFGIIPLAIHGSNRYRLSRSSWRGIHFGYRGKLGELYKLVLLNGLLTVITLGLYGSWFEVELKKYIFAHRRFGNVEFKYEGKGLNLFLLRLKSMLLIIITLGIYSFWYIKNLIQFEVNSIKVLQNGKQINIRSTLTGGEIFGMLIINYFIVVFTLGIGTGIAINRTLNKVFSSIEFDDELDPNSMQQTEQEYKDAMGDDLAGFFDISIA